MKLPYYKDVCYLVTFVEHILCPRDCAKFPKRSMDSFKQWRDWRWLFPWHGIMLPLFQFKTWIKWAMAVVAVGEGVCFLLEHDEITLEMIPPPPPKFSLVILLNIHSFTHSLGSSHLLTVIGNGNSPVSSMGLVFPMRSP